MRKTMTSGCRRKGKERIKTTGGRDRSQRKRGFEESRERYDRRLGSRSSCFAYEGGAPSGIVFGLGGCGRVISS